LVAPIFHIPSYVSLAIVLGVLIVCITVSLIMAKKHPIN
jgi:hypothetical protein